MKSVVLPAMIAALLMLSGRPACAQVGGGIALNWDGCIGDGVVATRVFACDSNTGSDFVLYVSIIPPVDIPQFAATSAIVDITLASRPLPPWWQAATGQCRAGAISMTFDPVEFSTSCPDLWLGLQPLEVYQFQFGVHGLSYEVRLNAGAAIPIGTEFLLPADGVERTVCKIVITRSKSTGADACSGCSACAILDLAECHIRQPSPLPSYHVFNHFDNLQGWRWWNGSCDPTPTQNRSWGQIKGLYR